ncbi:MAG: fasciclin domain-containing protein [Odoribacteraceae bacterium]|jgi:hypothetical protein|nr:fasciclin domain-containing protein [Odoribacteraceae bacterium]
MKTTVYFFAILWMAFLGYSCSDQWDSRINAETVIEGNQEVVIVNTPVTNFLQSETSYSKMFALFTNTGVANELATKDQLFTVIVVKDDALGALDNDEQLAKMHISGAMLSPNELPEGQRMLMWNGKYVVASLSTDSRADGGTDIYLNGLKVTRVIKTTNAFVYEIESPLAALVSVYEHLKGLSDDYSLLKQMVFEQSTRVFDVENSRPLYTDETGNTVYDSVWIESNPFFDANVAEVDQKINIVSEFAKSTVFIPNNELLGNAIENAYLTITNALGREVTADDSARIESWVINALFYKGAITPDDYASKEDWKSAYGQTWRNTVQQVDVEHPIQLSNGIAYNVNYMTVPNNILISRIKQYFSYYQNCTAEEKAEYFQFTNYIDTIAEPVKVNREGTYNAASNDSPLPGVWPSKYYDCLVVQIKEGFSCTLTGLVLNSDGSVGQALIPPGEYTLSMGFKEKLKMSVDIYVNDVLVKANQSLDGGDFHFDRGSGSLPEGFSTSIPGLQGKPANYDRDGKAVGTVLFEGTEMQPIVIRIETTATPAVVFGAKFYAYHWCLKPTANNY